MKRSCNGEWSSSLLESVRDAMPHIGDPLNHDRMARLHLLTQYPASDEECVARVRSAVRDARPELLPETQRVDMSQDIVCVYMAELVSGEALLFAVLDPFELYLDPLPLEAIRIEALRPPGDVLRTWDI